MLAILLLAGCSKTQTSGYNPQTTTLYTLLSTGTNTTIFNSAVIKAHLDTVFSGTSLFTLFVPNNDACVQSGYPQSVVDLFSSDQARQWILYQTYAGTALSLESFIGKSEEKLIMADGDSVFVTGDSNRTFINGFELYNSEATATNGVLLALQNVLTPPKQNLLQLVNNDTSLSFMAEAIQLSTAVPDTISNLLSSGGPYTFLAADNDAFRKLGFTTPADLISVSPDSLRSMVLLSMIPQRLFNYDIADSSQFQTVNDSTLQFNVSGISMNVRVLESVDSSNVISYNVMAMNGVLFKLDELLDK